MRILYFLAIIVCFNSCKKNLHKQIDLKINEVAFLEDDKSYLESIEIYNPHIFKVQIDSIHLLIDETKFEIKNVKSINPGQIIFREIKKTINNRDFNIKLNINGNTTDEFHWKSSKKRAYIGRYPDGSKLIVPMSSRSLGKTNNERVGN